MENFILAFNVIMPLFILIILGHLIKKVKLITEESIKQFNLIIY